jgi:hypothetical protein
MNSQTRAVVLLLTATPWLCHAQSDDLNQLKTRVTQLEQMVQELKAQLAAGKGQVLTAPTPEPPPAPGAATAEQVTSGTSPNTLAPEEATGPTMDIYGAAMFDTGHQFGAADPNWFDVLRTTKLPSYPGQYGKGNNWFTGVRQSRFGVKTSTHTSLGELKTIFEFELFGTGADAGQTTFRLRHAWGELGQIGAGQTWSPFMDADVFPNSVEYWGPPGMVFFRNVQLRWTPWHSGDSNFMMAIERPGASADGGAYSNYIELQNIKGRFPAPDFSSHIRIAREWGHFQLGGIVRRIDWDALNPGQHNVSGNATGWGLNLSSNIKVSKHVARLQAVYGEGIENYMNDSTVDIGPRNTTNPNQPVVGKPVPVLGIVAFMDFNWNKYFTSTAGYSLEQLTNTNASNLSDFHRGQYGVVNLLYYPVKNMLLGPEFQWGKRTNWHDGYSYDDYKIQFSVKYNFKYHLGAQTTTP